MKKQNMNKHYQKQNIKKEYAAARNAGSQTAGTATKSTGKKLSEKASDKIKEFFEKNKKVFIWIGVGIAVLVLLGAGISSCSMLTSTGSSVIASSYLSEDDAMLGAEAQYCRMEQDLQHYLDTYESTHNYDEYHFDLDDIEHDPYVLISILSALHEGEFTLDEVQGTLQMLFEKQYILTEEVIVETRYRTETDTWTDADGNTHTETYRVPYDYYICNVKLENFNLSHVPVYIMSQEQLSMYATYMSVLGNREDLFGDSPYVDKYITNPPADYDVNPEYLNDEKFATLITEAEKYLGYPYVWGGSNPDTSFDCSGFVSYVLTNSGLVNTGRLGAQGLYNVCTPVSKANAQPGDLIFFVGTYDTPGVSHVGIYVGDGVMIPFSTHPSILPTGSSISTPSEDPPIKRKEFCMNPKYQKVLSDIEKAEKKKSEIEGQLKELYDKKTELENLEIINTVRSMVMDKDQIMAFLSSMKGGTKPAENTEVIDNA